MNSLNKAYTDSKGNSVSGSGYNLVKVDITNVARETKDIRNIVGYIKISESLFNPSLVLEMGIRDESNFFEEFNLSGNEEIDIEIDCKALNVDRNINLKFYVTEYRDYARGIDTQVQAYTIIGVSKHAYLAPLRHISRSVEGTSTTIISNILQNDLDTKVVVQGKCLSSYSGIITSTNPLKAAYSILQNTFDENNTPYLLFQRMSGNVYLTPLSYLVDLNENPIYKELKTKIGSLSANPGTIEDYYERSTIIRDLNSKINIAPSYQAKNGVFASQNRYIDIGTKTYRTFTFDAAKHLKAEHTLSKKLNVSGEEIQSNRASESFSPYNKIPSAKVNYQYVNQQAFNGNDSVNSLVEKNKHISDAYLNNYDVCTHEFKLFGDPYLNPGRVVRMLFPKATDPISYKSYTGKSITETFYDRQLSGPYMVFSTTHVFEDSNYETHLVVKTDSIQPDDTV